MKHMFVAVLMVAALAACSQQETVPEPKAVPLESEKAKLGYAMGIDAGLFFKQIQNDAEADAFVDGFRAAVNDDSPRLSLEEVNRVKDAYFAKMKKKAEERQKAELAIRKKREEMQANADVYKKESEAFLKANAKRDGIITTASGLQYEVVLPSEGAKPTVLDTVRVHYRGTLIDGEEFDSSYSRGKPAEFPLNRVIPGWIEGLQLMGVGSKYRFYIPSDLAYGEQGAGVKIGPNMALIFEVELLDIVKPKVQTEEMSK